jgi:hypothetical protein
MAGRLMLAAGLALSLGAATLAQAADLPTIDQSASMGVHEPLDRLTNEVEHLHPIAMMFLARRLFDAGRPDEAVFWFYEAQLRWNAHLDQHPDGRESERYGDLFERIGPDINVAAFHDPDALLATLDAVIDWDLKHPDDYTDSAKARDGQRAGLKDFEAYIRAHRPEIEARRRELDAQAPPPGSDPYAGNGGALFAQPSEMLTEYDPALFASLRPGVTGRDEVLKVLGKPEWWDTGDDGASVFGYSYSRSFGAGAPLGMTERVQVSVRFDAHKVVTQVELPAAQ